MNNMTAKEIKQSLSNRFSPGKGYLFITELLSRGIVEGMERRIDGVVISTFPSMGLYRMGIEIKTSRSDLISELNNPQKSNSLFSYFEKFALAVPTLDICQGLDIPDHWGIIVVTKNRSRFHKQPKFNDKAKCNIGFVTRLVQRIITIQSEDFVHIGRYQRLQSEQTEIINEEVKRRMKVEKYKGNYSQEYNDLLQKVKIFENASGIGISHIWKSKKEIESMGKIVKILSSGKFPIGQWELAKLESNVNEIKTLYKKFYNRED